MFDLAPPFAYEMGRTDDQGRLETKSGSSGNRDIRFAQTHFSNENCGIAGSESLDPATEKEDDLLDKAWGLELTSRLSCQARMKESDVTIEIPKYTLNQVSESRK